MEQEFALSASLSTQYCIPSRNGALPLGGNNSSPKTGNDYLGYLKKNYDPVYTVSQEIDQESIGKYQATYLPQTLAITSTIRLVSVDMGLRKSITWNSTALWRPPPHGFFHSRRQEDPCSENQCLQQIQRQHYLRGKKPKPRNGVTIQCDYQQPFNAPRQPHTLHTHGQPHQYLQKIIWLFNQLDKP